MSARSESAMRASRGRTVAALVAVVVWASAGDAPMRTSRSPAAVDVTRRERQEAGGMGGKAAKGMVPRPAHFSFESESVGSESVGSEYKHPNARRYASASCRRWLGRSRSGRARSLPVQVWRRGGGTCVNAEDDTSIRPPANRVEQGPLERRVEQRSVG